MSLRFFSPLSGLRRRRSRRPPSWQAPAARTSTAAGLVPTHDDRLLAAALVAAYDDLVASGALRTGRAVSRVVRAADPLDEMSL